MARQNTAGANQPTQIHGSWLQQNSILAMQHASGNSAVQRYLSDHGQDLRLQPEEEKGEKPKGEAKSPGFDIDQWLSSQVYDLVKSQLGDAKLKEYAAKVAKSGADLLMSKVSGATSAADLASQVPVETLGKWLADDITKAVVEILASPAGVKAKQAILTQAKTDPGSIIALSLAALTAAALANAEIPELDKKFDLGAGFSGQAGANLGKFQDIALKHVKLGLSYSSKYFRASTSGEYTGESTPAVGKQTAQQPAGFSAAAEAATGPKEVEFKSGVSVNPSGEFKLDIGPSIDLKKFGLTATATYAAPKGWLGVGQLRLGTKSNYWMPKLTVNNDGKLNFELGHQFKTDLLVLSSTLKHAGGSTSMAHKIDFNKMFGSEALKLSASIHYNLEEPQITAAKFSGDYKILEGDKDKGAPYLLVKIEGSYQAPTPDKKKTEYQGMLLLEGRY